MSFTINTISNELEKAVKKAVKMLDGTYHIWKVALVVKSDGLWVGAYDGRGISAMVKATSFDIPEEFKSVHSVEYRDITKTLREIGVGVYIRLSFEGEVLTIYGDARERKVKAEEMSWFFPEPGEGGSPDFYLDGRSITHLVENFGVIAGESHSGRGLEGIRFIQKSGAALEMRACDGAAIAWAYEIAFDNGRTDFKQEYTVPMDYLNKFARVLDKSERYSFELVKGGRLAGRSLLAKSFDGYTVVEMACDESRYPDLQAVKEVEYSEFITVSRRHLREAMQKAKEFASKEGFGTVINMKVKDGWLRMESDDHIGCEDNHLNEVARIDGMSPGADEKFQLNLNSEYVLAACEGIIGDCVMIKFNDMNSQLMFTGYMGGHYIIMPMRKRN